MKNVAGKTRKIDQPYAEWRDPRSGFDYKLIKSWQGNNSKDFARWYMAVQSPYTFGSFEYGDAYVYDMQLTLAHALRGGTTAIYWDTAVWPTFEDFKRWVWGKV